MNGERAAGPGGPLLHREPGGSWRPLGVAAGVLAVLVAADAVLPGPGLPGPAWALVTLVVLVTVAAGCLAARRVWTVCVEGRGDQAALVVGRERLPLSEVDAAHLLAVRAGRAGVDAGAPVLGGGGSLPRGRTGLPLRRTDGHTVLVPTRQPASLVEALLTAHPCGPPRTAGPGTLGA